MSGPTHEELEAWRERMQQRTLRLFEREGGTPPGWHLLLPHGDFGFHDVVWPVTADEHEAMLRSTRATMTSLAARACLFVMQRTLADGREVVLFQYEAMDARGSRRRAASAYAVKTAPDGTRRVDAAPITPHVASDVDLVRAGLFPDLLPDASPLRIR